MKDKSFYWILQTKGRSLQKNGVNREMHYIYFFLLYAIEVTKFYIIYKDFYSFQEREKKEWIVLITCIVITTYIMEKYSLNINPLFIYVPFILLEGYCLFKVSILPYLIYSFFAMEITGILDAIFTILVETIMELCGKNDISFQKIFVSGFTLAFIYGVDKSLRRKNKSYKNNIPFVYIIISVIIGIGSNVILGLFQKASEEYGSVIYKVIFLFVAIGAFLDMVMILILAETNEVYKRENKLNKEYLALQNKHYAYLEKREYETKKFRHDITNHILILNDLCKKGEIKKAEQYIEKVWGKINEVTVSITVNHGIIDAILNQYASICLNEGISLKVEGRMPEKCKIDAFDLCTVFSNLLTNAIEAGRESTKKQIKLEIRYDSDTIYLYVENYYVGEQKIKNGIIVSQKNDKNRHGYGLINIQECVEKYNGIFEYQIERERFIVMIAMRNCIANTYK